LPCSNPHDLRCRFLVGHHNPCFVNNHPYLMVELVWQQAFGGGEELVLGGGEQLVLGGEALVLGGGEELVLVSGLVSERVLELESVMQNQTTCSVS